MMSNRVIPPIHPGEMLKEEFMEPMGLSANKLAQECNLAVTRITDIIRGRRGITADTALAFAARFRNSPEFWMNLQSRYDLEVAKMKRVSSSGDKSHPSRSRRMTGTD
jgi:addiction module HigA family antidote